jgi:hypothetical protein
VSKKMVVFVLVALVLALGVTNLVSADESRPPVEDVCPYGGTCGGNGMGGNGYHGTMPTILGETLGLSIDELYAALEEGKTIADLASAQGVEFADLVAALVAPRIEHLEQAVADGYMTQEQADWMIEQMTEHMTWQLENFGLNQYGGGGGCGMMGGGHGHFGGQSNGIFRGHRGGMHGGGWGDYDNMPRFPGWSTPSDGA